MFNLNCEMDLFEFDQIVGFWSGAKDRWDEMSREEQNYLNDCTEGMEFDSITSINDFVWFDSDDLLEEFHKNSEEDSDDDDLTED